jgi:glucosamine--fructose-6-phosphate aminotransferase (isomerizing)
MLNEIKEQPSLFSQNAATWQKEASDLLERFPYQNMVLLGRGSSGNAAVFTSYLLFQASGRHPIEFRPSGIDRNPQHADWSDSLVAAFSASGESNEIIHAVQWLAARGAKTLAVTNGKAECSLAKVSHATLHLGVGEELAIPATKSFCAQLVVGAALAGHDLLKVMDRICNCMSQMISGSAHLKLLDFVRHARIATFLGYGDSVSAALDAALKLQETVGIPSTAYSIDEFFHGPLACLTCLDRVIIFYHSPKKSIDNLIIKLQAKNVPFMIVCNDVSSDQFNSAHCINIGLPEESWCATPLFAFLSQLLAYQFAVEQGKNPDRPEGLSKITKI